MHLRVNVNFNAVHRFVSLLVVRCIDENLIEYFVQSRNIGNVTVDHLANTVHFFPDPHWLDMAKNQVRLLISGLSALGRTFVSVSTDPM